MTPLEITGFALVTIVALGLGLACWAQRREIERLRVRGDEAWRQRCEYKAWYEGRESHTEALILILEATRNGKSGTAKMVHRMAMEGLNDEHDHA